MTMANTTDNKYEETHISRKQVAVLLYFLSDEGRYRKTANAVGIARTTVSKIVRTLKFSSHLVIRRELRSKFITLPTSNQDVKSLAANFYHHNGFPQCIGAVDDTYIYTTAVNQLSRLYKQEKQVLIDCPGCL